MRHTATYLQILFALLLASCGNSAEMRRLLEHADSLNQAYAPLDTVAYMERVADYYETFGSREDRIRAFYLLGSVYRDKQDSPRALEWFDKAIASADTTAADCDFRLLSRICAQSAAVLQLQRLYPKAVSAWDEAMLYAMQAKDTVAYVQFLEHKGYALWGNNIKDEAVRCERSAYRLYLQIGRKDLAAASLSLPIIYYLQGDSVGQARKAIVEYCQNSGNVEADGTMRPGAELFYYYLGQLHEKSERLDSAEYYYRRLIASSKDIQNLENGYWGLLTVWQKRHEMDSVVKYSRLYANANDTANVRNSAQELIRSQALYDYSAAQKEARGEAEKSQHLGQVINAVIIITLALAFLSWRYWKKNKAAQKKNKKLRALREKAVNELEQARADMDELKLDKDEEIAKLEESISVLSDKVRISTFGESSNILFREIMEDLNKKVATGSAMTVGGQAELLKAVQEIQPEFFNALLQNKGRLTDVEFVVCVLTRLRLTPSAIGVLMNIGNPQRVTNIRRSINLKLFNDSSAKTLNENIQRLGCLLI